MKRDIRRKTLHTEMKAQLGNIFVDRDYAHAGSKIEGHHEGYQRVYGTPIFFNKSREYKTVAKVAAIVDILVIFTVFRLEQLCTHKT
jgi:hypothetical protein